VDALPNLLTGMPPNLGSTDYLELPRPARARRRGKTRKILLTFGGEDAEDLTGRMIDAIRTVEHLDGANITVVEGPLFRRHLWPRGVVVLTSVSRMAAVIRNHDLVFTHFGMSAFEALAIGVPVILLNPTEYHRRLGAAAGIPDIGVRTPDPRTLRYTLEHPEELRAIVEGFQGAAKRGGALARLLLSLHLGGSSACPACGAIENRVVARFPDRTYRRCHGCGTVHLQSFSARRQRYRREYFFKEYRAQYGRTYLEDFQSIKQASRARLAILRRLGVFSKPGALVDVGCAFGPFLAAAREAGLQCFGLDVSAAAVDYVRKNLGLPAVKAGFEIVGRRSLPERISCITLWYVLEHFENPAMVIGKAASLLPAGGLFAFSTPNGRGISARKSLRLFLEKSPDDHYAVFSPKGLRVLLAAHGLKLKIVRVTGHHPERFPGAFGRAAAARPLPRALLGTVSRVFGLGDTFEAYAIKGDPV
jgi:2-polyprenyl-3-methyl-5-hydroxy-6-metoxy-1,4-benzoquinol methylase